MMEKARRMMRSPLTRAFDLEGEPQAALSAYGTTAFGKRCVIARRLVEAGVRCVEVELSGWDTHQDNFTGHTKLMKEMDPAVSALLDDLEQRELLASTLILWVGEFGRSPKINAKEGRDHHPRCFSAFLAGGGVRGGQVIGATSDDGETVTERPITVPDLLTTVLHLLGISPTKLYYASDRPVTLGNGGKIARELMG
jgi:uncharacterized protein (DUF1501 family)